MVIGRLFNTVGPRQTGRYGMVVPTFVRQALAGQRVTVHGDGTQRRCFCHVDDVVRALVDLMVAMRRTAEVFNIGSTEEISMIGSGQARHAAVGSDSEIALIPYEEAYEEGFEDMARRVPDTGRESRAAWLGTGSDARRNPQRRDRTPAGAGRGGPTRVGVLDESYKVPHFNPSAAIVERLHAR